ncbi:MAG: hypothetical protein NTW30_05925 [Candidatus Aenigmarchaeota archaeon]|nr:hypothetical protein [Candidatus Aenigmarchaeota archaeon]
MKEQEFKEIRTLITKTESCLNTLKNRIEHYKLEVELFPSGDTIRRDFREPTYGIKKKIDWNIVRARRAYNYSWRKIAGEMGVSHTTLIKRARKMHIT